MSVMENEKPVENPLKKKISLLKKQIIKLDNSDFDLEAWKSSTIIVLEKIFGASNQKIRQIEKIQLDFSSWSLRDSSGSLTKLDTCKKRGKEILEVCIDELESFGFQKEEETVPPAINQALEEHLTISQYKAIKEIMQSDQDKSEQKKLLKEKIEEMGKDKPLEILVEILFRIDM
jgi:hypothetical protein